jgi:hypothetical protein
MEALYAVRTTGNDCFGKPVDLKRVVLAKSKDEAEKAIKATVGDFKVEATKAL